MLGNHRLTASLNRRSVRVPQSDTLHLYQLSCQGGLHQLTGLLCIWLFSVGDSQMECGKISYFSFLPAFQPLPAPAPHSRTSSICSVEGVGCSQSFQCFLGTRYPNVSCSCVLQWPSRQVIDKTSMQIRKL